VLNHDTHYLGGSLPIVVCEAASKIPYIKIQNTLSLQISVAKFRTICTCNQLNAFINRVKKAVNPLTFIHRVKQFTFTFSLHDTTLSGQ